MTMNTNGEFMARFGSLLEIAHERSAGCIPHFDPATSAVTVKPTTGPASNTTPTTNPAAPRQGGCCAFPKGTKP